MPATFNAYSDAKMVEQLARDNDQLATENKRLNQIVDAFCALGGADVTQLPTLKKKLADALEASSLGPIHIRYGK